MSNKDVFVTGYFLDASFNIYNADGSIGKILNNTGLGGDVFTVKYDSNGYVQWTAQMGGLNNVDIGRGVSTDSNNNVYVTGYFQGASFNIYNADGSLGKTLNNTDSGVDVFTVKYDSNGYFQWASQMGGLNNVDSGTEISTDSNNNVYVTGFFGDATFNIYNADGSLGKTLNNIGSGQDVFTVKYNSNGYVQWAAQMGGININDKGFGISNDSNNNVYVIGYFADASFYIYNADGSLGKTLNNTGSGRDVFTVKYDSNGYFLWAAQMGKLSNNNNGYDISTDSNNNVYVTGYFQGESFNIYNADGSLGKTLNNTGSTGADVFTVKYDSNGYFLWATQMGAIINTFNVGNGISIDYANNIFVTGYFQDTSLNIYNADGSIGKTLNCTGLVDVFTVKFNSNGYILWAVQMGGLNNKPDFGNAISNDSNNNVYVTGSFEDDSFNIYNADGSLGKTLNNTGLGVDVFTVKYNPNGYVQWAAPMGGMNNDSSGINITCSKKQIPIPIPISNICFLSDTPITVDQGIFPIMDLNPKIHTINNKKIISITKTITQDDYLVVFEKNALGINLPNKKTVMSKDHKIFYHGKLIESYKFLGHFEKVKKYKYQGEIMCNILMEKYEKIKVNNLVCETLHPENFIAKLYNSTIDSGYKNKIINIMNNSILKNDNVTYKKIMNHLHSSR